MLAILLSPLYVLVNAYIIRWIIRWLSTCRHEFRRFRSRLIVSMVYLFFASAMGVGFFLPSGGVKRFFVKIGNYWLGVLLYTILVVGAADVIHVLLKRSKKINQEKLRSFKVFVASGIICAVGIAVLSIWGMVNAGNIRTTKYEAVIDKKAGNLKQMKVVMAADLHMGYNIGCEHIQKMVEKINAQEPDLVVFAGDIFDNEYEALEDPKKLIDILKGIKSKYGVYACYGNHDIKEKILAGFTFGGSQKKESDIRMDEFLKEAGITLLRDESVLIGDSVYLYGRPDRQRPGRDIKTRKTPEEITAG
ncbi:metallophosphoesterase, partial [Sporofaciens musculi]